MIQNYFKIAIRNLLRHKFFSLINIFGLAAGMSICLLIISMLMEQKSFDQFHTNKDRTYRVNTDRHPDSETATSPALLAEELEKYAAVAQTTRLKRGFGGDATYNQTTIPIIGFFADSTFLDVFDFPLKYGNPKTALNAPFSILLSQENAEKLFGEENPLGKTIAFSERGLEAFGNTLGAQKGKPYGDFTVTGVFEKTSLKSHIPLEAFMSFSTREALVQQGMWEKGQEKWSDVYGTYTYAVLKEGYSEADFSAILDQVAQREFSPLEKNYQQYDFVSQALTKITPSPLISNPMGSQLPLEAYYLYGVLAFLIMTTAAFNYTNLSIARSLTRAKEVGIRKVSGAFRYHLFAQFIGESIIVALIGLGIGIVFFQVLKTGFVNLWVNQYLNFELPEPPSLYLYFIAFGISVGIMAGLYPALYMSRYSPVQVLKNFRLVRPGGLNIRKVLITLQFALSLIFVLSTIILFKQFNHYLHIEYGFAKENILNVALQGQDFELVSNRLSQVNTVGEISGCWFNPASGVTMGTQVKLAEEGEGIQMNYMIVTPNYFENHEIPIVAGNSFRMENATGHSSPSGHSASEVVINEKAARLLGFDNPQEAIGSTLLVDGFEDGSASIAGVVRDFQDRLAMQEINPLILYYDPARIKIANVRVLPTDIRQILTELEESWATIDPAHAFEAKFLEDQLNNSLRAFVDILKVFGFLTFLAVSIACLGLLGMAVFTAESRIKEVGIRKVLGANVMQLIVLLSKGFLQLLLVAMFIAVPAAYFLNNLWMQNFANRIALGPGIFLSGVVIMLVLGLVIIVSQTFRAAMINPVESLKDE